MKLLKLISKQKAHIGVIGMGYVGLPLARIFAHKGFRVTGFDVDASKIKSLTQGKSYIKHIPAREIKELRKRYHFSATTNFRELKKTDIIIICVPTPLTEAKEPDLSYIEKTAQTITQHLRKGQLVILESTTYPGTTDEVVKPILEKTKLVPGRDFYLAYSPEREDPGNPTFSTSKIPKVVGGIDKTSLQLAKQLYAQVVTRVIPVSSCRAAEATKLLENIYRSVNIALVNELKTLFDRMKLDVWEIINAASTKPFGFHPFYPGPGLGGHCIPIDPFYLSWKARQYKFETRFIELAGKINTAMPDYVVNRIVESLTRHGKNINGARILILGMAYKKDVDDMRESPALKIIELLKELGAEVNYHDPHIPRFGPLREYKFVMRSVKLTSPLLKRQHCVLITTDHSQYDYDWIVKHSRLVVDTRNATQKVRQGRAKIVRA